MDVYFLDNLKDPKVEQFYFSSIIPSKDLFKKYV